MENKIHLPPHINLVGDPEENFYTLGLKDKKSAPYLINHIKSLIQTPWNKVNQISETIAKSLIKQMFKRAPVLKKNIKAYSEGLNLPMEEIALCYIIPELLSGMDKWLPSTPLGCSSFFLYDEINNCPIHGRIFDFPMLGTFDQHARTITTHFTNSPATFSYSSSGLMYPSLTAQTEYGVSFALHQKYSNHLDTSGTPIFELVYQMLRSCGDKKSTLEYLKHIKSISSWAFHLSFSNGDILAADIFGAEKDIKTYKLDSIDPLYFNNKLLNKTRQKSSCLPYGFETYNLMREKSSSAIIKNLSKLKKKTDLDLLIQMATIPKSTKNLLAKNYNLSPLTPSSLEIVCMTPKINKSLSIHTSAPKFYQGSYLEQTDLFNKHKRSIKKGPKAKTPEKLRKGISFCMQGQVAIDQKNTELAYHNFQMGINYLDGFIEKEIAEFFFLALRFCHEKHSKVQNSLLQSFRKKKDALPQYLNDHLLLFIMRLELILQGKTTVKADHIKNEELKKTFNVESKIPQFVFHNIITKTMSIRYDTLDIIYPHAVH